MSSVPSPSAPPPSTSPWLAFLAGRGARLENGRVADFGDPQAEALAARDATLLADLSHNALLSITGDDATTFLQGQFTNDLQALPPGGAQWNGWCSPKGRLLATFLVLKREDGYLLMMPAEVAASVAKRLAMFVLRAKVKIADASAQLARIGFAGKTAGVMVARHWGHTPDPMRSVHNDAATCVALSADRFVILAAPADAQKIWDALAQNAVQGGVDAWEWTSIHAGIPTIVSATQESFVPQMANFELVGGVSFKKGCYTGQEIVARTQYRGILKKRMALAHLDGGVRPAPGQSVYSKAFGDQAAGEIVNVAAAPEGAFDLLVVAQLEALRAGDLRVASPDGAPLSIVSHPGGEPGA